MVVWSCPCSRAYTFQGAAIPIPEVGRQFIRGLDKRMDGILGRIVRSDGLVRKKEQLQLRLIIGRAGPHRGVLESRRLGRRVPVKRRLEDWRAAGPEPVTDHLM